VKYTFPIRSRQGSAVNLNQQNWTLALKRCLSSHQHVQLMGLNINLADIGGYIFASAEAIQCHSRDFDGWMIVCVTRHSKIIETVWVV